MNYFLFHESPDYEQGAWLSRLLDTGEKETVWHRMTADITVGENVAADFCLYATDSQMEMQRVEIERKSGQYTVRQQMERMKGLKQLVVRNPEDILLHQVEGRFLWLGILMWGTGEEKPEISTIQMFYPKETWNRYLPELYQGKNQEFLERFLGIFQSVYQDMEERVIRDAACLDIQAADAEMLSWLSGWIHVENSHLWPEDRLRRYLKHGAAWFSRRGTAGALVRMVEIYTGEPCYLVESEGGRVFLMIREAAVADGKTYRAVERIIKEGKPADVSVRLIPLKPYLFLNQNSYLGINSVLNQYRQATLNQEGALSFVILGKSGGEGHEESDVHAID